MLPMSPNAQIFFGSFWQFSLWYWQLPPPKMDSILLCQKLKRKERMMKKKFFVLALLGLLLASCGSSGEADITLTTPPTDTPPPPTATPEPTATPTPQPMPTPTPEPTLRPPEEDPEFENLAILMEAERTEYFGGYYRWSIGLANAMIDTWLGDYPNIYVLRAESYTKLGNFEQATKDLETAVELPYLDDPEINLSMYNNLCWYLGINGEAERALPHCEKVMALAEETESTLNPTVMYVDSRGLVYGMLGRTEEAITDFERVLSWAEENPGGLPAEMAASRQEWLDTLKQGENPFSSEVLEQLRTEAIDPLAYPEPEMLEDYSRQHFVDILEKDGFFLVESGVEDNDLEYEFYGLMSGECMIGVVLLGPEDEIIQARMVLNGCEEYQYIPELRWFAKLLMLNNPREDIDCIQMGEWYAWELTELQNLVEGEIRKTDFSVGNVEFTAVREDDPESGTWITLFGY